MSTYSTSCPSDGHERRLQITAPGRDASHMRVTIETDRYHLMCNLSKMQVRELISALQEMEGELEDDA